MDQDNLPPVPDSPPAEETAGNTPAPYIPAPTIPTAARGTADSAEDYPGISSVLVGENGLRAGWSILIFAPLYYFFSIVLGTAAALVVSNFGHGMPGTGTALATGIGESVPFLALIFALLVVGLIERRNILAYNLRDTHSARNFLFGLVTGFVALSTLIGGLAAGGWLRFGAVALTGPSVLKFAALWSITFLLVSCFEEGLFRCYLQFTLTRGINFWWALALITGICIDLFWRTKGSEVWGVVAIAVLGLLPCFALHWLRAESAGFWQAAWVTSTYFGFIHTSNNGENWVGIFAAAAIGFVFCVSVRVTGSAWWAIGCHFAWDWAETYFYGAADSGLPAQGHFLTTNPTGNVLWSGGTDGPEGSLLVLAVILLLLIALLVCYRGKRPSTASSEAMELRTA